MERLKLVAVVIVTAVLSCALTSAFWLVSFNLGPVSAGSASVPAPGAVSATAQSPPPPPVARGKVVLGPTGLAVPVAGVKPAALVDTFTQARSGGRPHDAMDITAPHGTPVMAAAPGTVEKLYFSEGGGGISAYVRSPDQRWIYYYAHLQDYAPGLREGARVGRGDAIGRVGSTGNANPAGPHLHFAIKRMEAGEKWYQGAAINPYLVLAGR